MAELRDVVAVFVGFEGIDHVHDEDAGTSLDACVSWAQEVLGKYEGVVLQVLIDDKGCHLYAVFGASISHEDEARRAVIAALELTEPSPESGVTIQSQGRDRQWNGLCRLLRGAEPDDLWRPRPGGESRRPDHAADTTREGPRHRGDRCRAKRPRRFLVVGPREFKGIDRAVTIHRATAVDGHGPVGHLPPAERRGIGRP